MAKNLKLKIKNTQLAAALQLGKTKKAPAAEKKSTEAKKAAPSKKSTAASAASIPSPAGNAGEESSIEKIEPAAVISPKEEKEIPAAPIAEPKEEAPLPPEEAAAEPVPAPPPAAEEKKEETAPLIPENDQASPVPTTKSTGTAEPIKRKFLASFVKPKSRFYTSAPAAKKPAASTPATEKKADEKSSSFSATARPAEELEDKKKSGFKEYRDLKPQKKGKSQKAFDSRDKLGLRDTDDENWRKRKSSKGRYLETEEVIIRPKEIKVRTPISIKDLAAEMKLKASELMAKLFMQGVILTLNDYLDDETTIQLLGHEFGCEITIDTSEEQRLQITGKSIKEEIAEASPEVISLRPPIIAFMGHVDHGKTSLIDAIRKSDLASGEAGAITQHVGAFTCHTAVGNLTILDTPGHEAFSAMRARGADVTDIIVLVIAGDEGIRAQTIEAISQAKEAKVPILVAINKCDKPNFNPENVYRQLSEQELLPEAWGGSTITVNCSALTKEGVKELLEMLALQAEVLELRANPTTRARGTVIESEMHKGLGVVATLLIQNGTLRLGDALVFDRHWAKVKTMHDEHDNPILQATPSMPVKITGLSGIPAAGSEFIVVKNEKEAKELSEKRVEGERKKELELNKRSMEKAIQQKGRLAEKKILNLILRTDVQGSLEALKTALLKLPSKMVEINFISSAVGEISEADVQLASTSKAVILGFHTQIERHAETLIKELKVLVKLHTIIYHAVDDIKAHMVTLLDKIEKTTDTGKAQVKAVFKSSQLGLIAGCQVVEGTIHRNDHIRLMRNNTEIWKGEISSLKRVKDDVKEVNKGVECGILLRNFSDVKENDLLEAFEVTYFTPELE